MWFCGIFASSRTCMLQEICRNESGYLGKTTNYQNLFIVQTLALYLDKDRCLNPLFSVGDLTCKSVLGSTLYSLVLYDGLGSASLRSARNTCRCFFTQYCGDILFLRQRQKWKGYFWAPERDVRFAHQVLLFLRLNFIFVDDFCLRSCGFLGQNPATQYWHV